MKKRIILAAAMVAAVLTFTGCEKNSSGEEALKPVDEITGDVISCGLEFPEMVEVEEENFQIKYGLSAEDYSEYSLWWAGSGADADEICIIKANDKDKVKDAVSDRLEGQKEVFKDYAPEQYDKLCKAKISTRGDYVCFICTNDNEKADKAIDNDFE